MPIVNMNHMNSGSFAALMADGLVTAKVIQTGTVTFKGKIRWFDDYLVSDKFSSRLGLFRVYYQEPEKQASKANAAAGGSDIVVGAEWYVTRDGGEFIDVKKTPVVLAMSISDIAVRFSDLKKGAMTGDNNARYAYLVSLLDGKVKVDGSKGDDRYLEVGAGGKATVKGKAGDDILYVWHKKTVDYDGGSGSDLLIFTYQRGNHEQPAKGATVDLTRGTGTNPFGGSLTLKNVENVAGVFGAKNSLRGDGKDNSLQGGIMADTLRGEGGDDTIMVKYHTTLDPRATRADGGKGTDTLIAQLSDNSAAPFTGSGATLRFINILDLADPSKNTGTFHGGTFVNFEIYRPTGESYMKFDFRGSGASETAWGLSGDDRLDGRGGNDVLIGGGGADRLIGGKGKDTASYADTFFPVTANLKKPSANKGFAQGDTYSSIENLIGSGGADTLTGNDGANRIDGGGGGDRIGGGKGADTLRGGLGADQLTGGADADRFVFVNTQESTPPADGRDTILDFSHKQKDLIDLKAIDAKAGTKQNDAFAFIGKAAFSGKKGELRYEKDGKTTFVYGDVNGDGKADFAIQLKGAIDLVKGDFAL